jgi:hypothetical protein
MSFYKKDPNNSNKQVPNGPPKNFYGRVTQPVELSASKTPNYVIINTKPNDGDLGLYLGSSADFSASAAIESINNVGPALSGSQHYTRFTNGALPLGTKLDLHPVAWSGSGWGVTFVYSGGKDGSGRF